MGLLKMPAHSTLLLMLALLVALAAAQDTVCGTGDSSQKLRFVAQLIVNGCPVFVHDTGAKDGRHLAVEPLMCVMENIDSEPPRYDHFARTTYLSVRVTLRDNSVLAEVERQLRYLAPKSVTFANVSRIAFSYIGNPDRTLIGVRALGFHWTPDESVGLLRINFRFIDCTAYDLLSFRSKQFEVFKGVLLTATINTNGTNTELNYRPTAQNESLLDASVLGQTHLPNCQPYLRFTRSIEVNKCTARVHERLDKPGHFLIEPLLCLNTTRMREFLLTSDSSCCITRNYLKLDVVLQDEAMADIVKTKLTHLSPRSVTFMKLWRAQTAWTSSFAYPYSIGPLVVAADGKSGHVRVHCHNDMDCNYLREVTFIQNAPLRLLAAVNWTVESRVNDQCVYVPSAVNAQCERKIEMAKLRFVAQLNVNGCLLHVHDTGATDGPHLAIEPMMCITEDLKEVQEVRLSYNDPDAYVAVRLLVRDDALLSEVKSQLRHLSPKSVKFAAVLNISAFINTSLSHDAVFKWVAGEAYGSLKFFDRYGSLSNSFMFRRNPLEFLSQVELTANITSYGKLAQLKYRPFVQNETDIDMSVWGDTYLPRCQLQFIRSIDLDNCLARVHERLDNKGHFLVEPLLCQGIRIRSNRTLRLHVRLKSGPMLELAKRRLADLSPRSVTFMRLWRAAVVQSALDKTFWVSSLMLSSSGDSAQLEIRCHHLKMEFCVTRLQIVQDNPYVLLKHVRWDLTSRFDSICAHRSARRFLPGTKIDSLYLADIKQRWSDTCNITVPESTPLPSSCQFSVSMDGRKFVTIQQRITGNVSFQRDWNEYESGFGDDSDFWIGLKAIHSLSKNGVILRLEMKRWDGVQLYAEFDGFKVGDNDTSYNMTYTKMLMDRSNIDADAMADLKENIFLTRDRNSEEKEERIQCSQRKSGSGWWYPNDVTPPQARCMAYFNPNGQFSPFKVESKLDTVFYDNNDGRFLAAEIRLMLQI